MVADGMRDEPPDKVGDRRAPAIAQVDEYIAGIPAAGRLPPRIMERYDNRGFNLGWRASVVFSNGIRREVHIIAAGDFPYTPPRIAVADGPEILAWPHLEEDGLLCILPSDAAVSSQDPAGVTAYVLGKACRLIEECISGSNVEDFRREFLSYWVLAAHKGAVNFISLLEPQGPGRKIAIWRGKGARVVGESPETLRRWLRRWGAKTGKDGEYKLYEGVLIWLPEPPVPAEYPHSAADVRALARHHSPEAADVLENLAARRVDEIDVLLGAQTANGACFGAVTVRPPRQPGGPKRKGDVLVKGFRPGRVPAGLLVDRYLSGAAKVTKATVKRADHLWINGRDQDPRQGRLREARVAILGCGSLGGSLARLMAQAGVGNLLLVDPATLDWPNVGRHVLGASSVSQFKAPELAREIEKSYPHLGDISWRRERVGPEAWTLLDLLAACDLIVSTMGNWAAENYLNDVQQESESFPPIVYGWVEPNAVAAHAIVMPRGDACLRCGVNDKGRPQMAVTDWPDGGDSLQAPACGAVFTPYGPAELCWAHALLSETVIDGLINKPASAYHRTWIGSRNFVAAAGGTWAANWIKEMGDPGAGGVTTERPWPASASCPVCARREHAA